MTPTRREMCRTLLRGVALTGIALVSGGLVIRDLGGDPARCRRLPTCEGCAAWGDCRLPQAVANRNHSNVVGTLRVP